MMKHLDHEYYYYLPDADTILHRRCKESVHAIYGSVLPTAVEQRLTTELKAIERCGFSTRYEIAAEIAEEARRLGHHVMTRGMISSSFVAWLCGISQVNPLSAHYLCECCHRYEPAEITEDPHIHGFDLPDAICPECGSVMHSDGADIFPEILMGKWFEREPEVFLNVAPAIRKDIIDWMKKRLHDAMLIRAGVARQGANGNINVNVHPGGIYLVPKDVEVSAVTELRECSDDDDFGLPVTVRDFSELYGVFIRFDVYSLPALGLLHDLEQATGIRQEDISMKDRTVLEVFRRDGLDMFSPPREDVYSMRKVVAVANPECFSDIVQVFGLLHGTGTWGSETEQLLRNGIMLSKLIAFRDDILRCLVDSGADFDTAFRIMDQIRKGRGLTDADRQLMMELNVPAFIIDSCERIQYVFPKSHGVEYAVLSWKLAWYKQNYPDLYRKYSSQFSTAK